MSRWLGSGMRLARWRLLLPALLSASLVFPGSVMSGSAAPASAQPIDIGSWLARIHSAAQRLNYSGTFIHQEGSRLQSSRLTHLVDASGEREKREMLDGQPREYIRLNDDVEGYELNNRRITRERRLSGDYFPGVIVAPGFEIGDHYNVRIVGTDRVAGRECDVAVIEPRDQLRFGYRFWIDRISNLLLRAQILNEHGMVIEQVGFTNISINDAIARSSLRPTVSSTKGWQTVDVKIKSADHEMAGWTIKAALPGFRKIRDVRRTFASGREVGQVVMTDGLAVLSVFIESPVVPGAIEGQATRGAMNVVMKRHGDHWITVVGQTPEAAVMQLANSLVFTKR